MADKMPSQMQFRERDYLLGRVRVPPDVLSLPSRSFVYAADTAQNCTSTLTTGLITNGASATVQIQIDDSAYFLAEAISMLSSLQTTSMDLATVQITDQTTSRTWSDVAIPMRDLAGKGDSPKYLETPQLLRPTSTINVQITNNTGSSAAFYIALIGRKIYGMSEAQASRMLRRSWFQYTIPFTSLAASAVGTRAQCKVYNESDFSIRKILSTQLINSILGASGGAESQEVMMMLKDTNGDRNYFNQKLPARLIVGSNANELTSVANSWSNSTPFRLPNPILVRRNAIIEAELDNKSTTAISSAFNITLEGCRIFDAV